MAKDILMVAKPGGKFSSPGEFKTLWLTATEFYGKEALLKQHDVILWQSFHTHGKYAEKARHADWFCVATNAEGDYIGSAFVIAVQDKWLIEYVMTDPKKRGKGAGTAVMARIMEEAKKAKITWVVLNCDPEALGGKLPGFYGNFGFAKVA